MRSAIASAVMRGSMWRASALVMSVLLVVSACASRQEKPKPAELAPVTPLLGVRLAWTAKAGEGAPIQSVRVIGRQVFVAGSDGTVTGLDAETGRDLWRLNVGSGISAGVGSDGQVAAVVTGGNDLVVAAGGKELWRQKLQADVYTAPLVAGGRVFVLSADRSVTAFDGATGRKLWAQQRPGEPLVLRQPGVMLAVGDTLVVGLSGRLVGMNPNSGTVRWEAPIASPRGTNDVERLVDLVAGTSRVGDSVCARAFQAGVGCVNAVRGAVQWSKSANGSVGVGGDEQYVFLAEHDGKVEALHRGTGERAWRSDRLQYRELTAPTVVGRSVVVGDGTGLVHLLSRDDGAPLNRLTTDGSAVVATPVVAERTLVVVTRSGGVFGFVPQ